MKFKMLSTANNPATIETSIQSLAWGFSLASLAFTDRVYVTNATTPLSAPQITNSIVSSVKSCREQSCELWPRSVQSEPVTNVKCGFPNVFCIAA